MHVATMISRSLITGAATALLAATAAQAQDYPNKPITLVVGYPPGGSTDVGGAGGALGAIKVAQAAPDGHTLLLGTNNEMAISGLVVAKPRYDAQRDFTPIGLIASQPMVLVAGAHTGVKNTEDFIAQVKKKPGKFSYGSSGVGTALHLAGEMVKESAGAYVLHIPYRGVAPLAGDLIGGQLEFGVFVLSSGLPHIKSGKVVALGVTQSQRSAAAPDIPALAEHPALKKVDISSWFALFGPAKLPDAVTQRLQKTLGEALASPELRKKLEESGATMAAPGIGLASFQAGEIAKFKRIVEFAKITE
jgi:tripartite-type tricarboxylate transporter receptor subunit TctC